MSTHSKDKLPVKKKKFLLMMSKAAVGGNVTIAIRKLKYSRSQVYKWRADDVEFAEKWDKIANRARETLKEEAEFALRKGILKGVPSLIIFSLKNLDPKNWKDRVEHGGEGGGPIKHAHAVPSLEKWVARKYKKINQENAQNNK